MDKKKLDLEEFNILQTLGIGSFGRVRLALHKESGEYCALKILKKHELVRLKQVDHVLSEHKILGMIQHPFMVNQRGIVQNERYLYIVMDFVPGGELFTYLRK